MIRRWLARLLGLTPVRVEQLWREAYREAYGQEPPMIRVNCRGMHLPLWRRSKGRWECADCGQAVDSRSRFGG